MIVRRAGKGAGSDGKANLRTSISLVVPDENYAGHANQGFAPGASESDGVLRRPDDSTNPSPPLGLHRLPCAPGAPGALVSDHSCAARPFSRSKRLPEPQPGLSRASAEHLAAFAQVPCMPAGPSPWVGGVAIGCSSGRQRQCSLERCCHHLFEHANAQQCIPVFCIAIL